MKATLFIIVFISACGTETDSDFIPLVPDNTPFIVSTLEFSPDTTHHFSEVFVGYVSNPEGFEVPHSRTAEELWWPMNNALVGMTTSLYDFIRTPENNATVSVTGPLNTSEKRTIFFEYQGKGVYGDVDGELHPIPGQTYTLQVLLPDGRNYHSQTAIPDTVQIDFPDTVVANLRLKELADGTFNETLKDSIKIPYTVPDNAFFIMDKRNYSDAYQIFGVPKGQFLYEQKSQFLRSGGFYGIYSPDFFPQYKNFEFIWSRSPDLDGIINELESWNYISTINLDLSAFFYAQFDEIGASLDGPLGDLFTAQSNAFFERDTSYLFEVSNIVKKENDQVLPKNQSDAIGVFGAYSTLYKKTTLIAKRDYE